MRGSTLSSSKSSASEKEEKREKKKKKKIKIRIDIYPEEVYNISRKRAVANYIFIICHCSFLLSGMRSGSPADCYAFWR